MIERLHGAWERLGDAISVWGTSALGAILVALIGIMFSRWAARTIRRLSQTTPDVDRTLLVFLEKVARVVILVVTVVAVLHQLGVPTASILAVLGAAGIGIGLALKDTLSDLAAGIVLLVQRPFAVGEAIEVNGTTGTALEIGLFAVRIRTFDGVTVTIPNRGVWNGTVRNFVRFGKRRLEIPVGVAYDSDLPHVVSLLQEVVLEDARVDREPAPQIHVQAFGASSIDLTVRAWTDAGQVFDVRSDLLIAIKQRLDDEGVSIPFPQREVRVLPPSPAVSGEGSIR